MCIVCVEIHLNPFSSQVTYFQEPMNLSILAFYQPSLIFKILWFYMGLFFSFATWFKTKDMEAT